MKRIIPNRKPLPRTAAVTINTVARGGIAMLAGDGYVITEASIEAMPGFVRWRLTCDSLPPTKAK